MADQEPVIWGMHAGKTGDADTLFLKHDVIGVGWTKLGDLSKLKPDREAFKAAVAAACPDAKPGAIPTNAGQLDRFVHEMKPGDLVAYPSKRDRQIHIGRVTGPYVYTQKPEPWIRAPAHSYVAAERAADAVHPRSAPRDRLRDELVPDSELHRRVPRGTRR